MTLATSRGNTYVVDWIDGPTLISGQIMMRMIDARPLAEIVAELDGLAWMQRKDEVQGDKRWEATKMAGISRDGDRVTVSFELEE